jgi:hypothetical protein
MHYVTHISHRMQKHRFGVTSPSALFVETAPGPPELEKWCIIILRPRCIGMHYVTHRSHRMHKYKIGVSCPSTLFVESGPVPPEHEKWWVDVSHPQMHQTALRDL